MHIDMQHMHIDMSYNSSFKQLETKRCVILYYHICHTFETNDADKQNEYLKEFIHHMFAFKCQYGACKNFKIIGPEWHEFNLTITGQ